ncbi:MAG: hypothetical protein WCJ64_02470 [Rhodospirillaceae bacterium]
MIDIPDDSIVRERRTSGGRFALFCTTDLPRDCALPWWGVTLDVNGDGVGILVRVDESVGETGWTLAALLALAVARGRAEAAVGRSRLTAEIVQHLVRALELETERRAGLAEAGPLAFEGLEAGEGWPWLSAEFADEGGVEFCASLTGDADEGVNLELLLTLIDQLVADAAIAMPGAGQLGGIGLLVRRALDTVVRRDTYLRRRS